MMKKFTWKLTSLLGVLAMIVAAAIHHALKMSPSAPAPSSESTSFESKSTKPPPDYRMLAERIQASAYAQQTPEELEAEEQYNRKQALAFSNELNNPDPDKRIEAVEQLGAYPSAEAEDLLTQALAQDTDASVRAIAAQTLDTLDKPSPGAIDALLEAIEDYAPEVQQASLLTLENWLNRASDKTRRAHIMQGLKNKARSENLAAETRVYLQELLSQAQGKQAEP